MRWRRVEVVSSVRLHETVEMVLAGDEYVVETLAPKAAKEAFTDRVRSRSRVGRAKDASPGIVGTAERDVARCVR